MRWIADGLVIQNGILHEVLAVCHSEKFGCPLWLFSFCLLSRAATQGSQNKSTLLVAATNNAVVSRSRLPNLSAVSFREIDFDWNPRLPEWLAGPDEAEFP